LMMLSTLGKHVMDVTSVRKDTGNDFLTGGTYDAVLTMSRWHLKCEQEGWPEGSVRVVGRAIVDGKL